MTSHHVAGRTFVGPLIACLGLLAAPASAQVFQLPVYFSFRPKAVEPLPGCVTVHELSVDGASGDYGFASAPLDALIGEGSFHDLVDRDDDDRPLLKSCVRVATGNEFRCRIAPNTTVRARLLLAHVPPYYGPGTTHYVYQPTAVYDIMVQASNGSALKVIASDVDLRTPFEKGKLTTDLGSYRKLWFTAKSDASGLLRFRVTSPSAAKIPLCALELYPFVAAPIRYQRIGSTYLQSTSGSTIPGLAEFNAGDYGAALTKFTAIADPLTRASAFLWLAGWLDGSEQGFPYLADQADASLAAPALQTNPRVRELRDQIQDFRMAELHFGLRYYSKSYALPPDGYGYFNPAYPGAIFAATPSSSSNAARHLYLAENLYRQVTETSLQPIIQWNGGAHPDPQHEVPPLAFRALDRIARIHYSMNSVHAYLNGSTPSQESLEPILLYESIWRDFDSGGFRQGEFKNSGELAMLCWMVQDQNHVHSENGGLPDHWTGADVPASWLDLNRAWWKPYLPTGLSAPPGAPSWAVAEREYLVSLRAAANWWVDSQGAPGEFGGGPGDDPELAALLATPLVALRQPADDLARESLVESSDVVLDGNYVGDGYYDEVLVDVEHSAEFTSYPLKTALALKPGDPHYLQACLDVAKHLSYAGNAPQAWAKAAPDGQLRFQSFYFNAGGAAPPSDPLFQGVQYDVPLNGKALMPAFQFLVRSRHPQLETELASWASAWVDDALAASGAKPRGLVPAGVRSTDQAFGNGGQWWTLSGGGSSYAYPQNASSLTFLYSGAFDLGHSLGGANAHQYLVPMVTLAKGLIALDKALDAGQTPSDLGVVGSSNWALYNLLLEGSFLADLALLRSTLLTDAALKTIDDPYEPGTSPYVTAQFQADLDALLSQYSGSYLFYLAQPQTAINVATNQWLRKGKNILIASLQRGSGWLRNFFPLGTTHALFTDRAFVYNSDSHQTLYGMLTGDRIGGGAGQPIATWETPSDATAPLEIAVLVNDLTAKEGTSNDRLRILLYNFQPVARTVDFRLWQRLALGKYWMRTGAASDDSDWFVSGYAETSVDFDRRGRKFSLTVPGQTQVLLELERYASLTPPSAFDVALSTDEAGVTLTQAGSTFVATVSAKTFNTGSAASPANPVRLYASLLSPTGAAVPVNGLGQLEIELPLTTNAPALPAVTSYQLPSAPATLAVPLSNDVCALLALGYQIRFRFRADVAGDFDPLNNEAVALLDQACF